MGSTSASPHYNRRPSLVLATSDRDASVVAWLTAYEPLGQKGPTALGTLCCLVAARTSQAAPTAHSLRGSAVVDRPPFDAAHQRRGAVRLDDARPCGGDDVLLRAAGPATAAPVGRCGRVEASSAWLASYRYAGVDAATSTTSLHSFMFACGAAVRRQGKRVPAQLREILRHKACAGMGTERRALSTCAALGRSSARRTGRLSGRSTVMHAIWGARRADTTVVRARLHRRAVLLDLWRSGERLQLASAGEDVTVVAAGMGRRHGVDVDGICPAAMSLVAVAFPAAVAAALSTMAASTHCMSELAVRDRASALQYLSARPGARALAVDHHIGHSRLRARGGHPRHGGCTVARASSF